MIITLIYRAIVAAVLALTVWNLFDEKEFKLQMNATLIIVPMLLRLLMIK